MSRSSILSILGIAVLLAPFAGLPLSLLSILLPIFGFCIVVIGFSIRAEQVRRERQDTTTSSSSEVPSVPASHGVSPL